MLRGGVQGHGQMENSQLVLARIVVMFDLCYKL